MKNADSEICVDTVDSMKRNQINNMGECICGLGQPPLIAIGIGILYGLHSNASTANNNWALCVLISWTSVYWLLLALPWFLLEKKRPGQPLPPGKNFLTAGLWQTYRAARQIWKLRQTLMYLISMRPKPNQSLQLIYCRFFLSRRRVQHYLYRRLDSSE